MCLNIRSFPSRKSTYALVLCLTSQVPILHHLLARGTQNGVKGLNRAFAQSWVLKAQRAIFLPCLRSIFNLHSPVLRGGKVFLNFSPVQHLPDGEILTGAQVESLEPNVKVCRKIRHFCDVFFFGLICYVGWSFGRLVGWVVVVSVGRSVSQPRCWSLGLSFFFGVDRLFEWLSGQFVVVSVN